MARSLFERCFGVLFRAIARIVSGVVGTSNPQHPDSRSLSPELKALGPDFYVAGQLAPEDLETIARQGIRSIINNRPDGEAANQPSNAELAERASHLGLSWSYVPIQARVLTAREREDMRAAVARLERPICAFCRTGARSTSGWETLPTDHKG